MMHAAQHRSDRRLLIRRQVPLLFSAQKEGAPDGRALCLLRSN